MPNQFLASCFIPQTENSNKKERNSKVLTHLFLKFLFLGNLFHLSLEHLLVSSSGGERFPWFWSKFLGKILSNLLGGSLSRVVCTFLLRTHCLHQASKLPCVAEREKGAESFFLESLCVCRCRFGWRALISQPPPTWEEVLGERTEIC